MSTHKSLALPGMEAYLDEEEIVFSSPIGRRHADTTPDTQITNTKSTESPHITSSSSKLWSIGKQTLDDERVFKFDEEERSSPAKEIQRKTRGKKTKKMCSRWDYSSSSSSSESEYSDNDKENNNKEKHNANIKELIEIEEKLAKIKLEKETETSTRLVIVVDTNCLMEKRQREAIFGLKHYNQLLFIVPFIVLQELDKLKIGNDEKSHNARQAVNFLNTEISTSRENIWIRGQCQNELPINPCKLLKSNDDQILKCCLYYRELALEQEPGNSPHDVLLVTLDRLLQVKAKSHNISSTDCVSLRAKMDDSWQETTRVATGIFFKDGKLCAHAASPTPQRSARTSTAQSASSQLRMRASFMHAASTNAAAANAPCREQVIALASARAGPTRAVPTSRNDSNFTNANRMFIR